MREVAAQLHEACSAAVLSDEDVVYVARVPGEPHHQRGARMSARRLPAYCTVDGPRPAVGPCRERTRSVAGAGGDREADTPKTVTDRGKLGEAIDKAGRDGFAIVDEELEIGLRSIAVPIRDRAGKIVAAINVSTQSARFSRGGDGA